MNIMLDNLTIVKQYVQIAREDLPVLLPIVVESPILPLVDKGASVEYLTPVIVLSRQMTLEVCVWT